MIVVQLVGGLGNQLFQYAAGRRLALVRGTGLRLDATALPGSGRDYGLEPFAIEAEAADAATLARVLPRAKGVAGRLRSALARRPGGLRRVRVRGFRFDPDFLELPDDVYLEGYFQSERYFADHAEAIRRELVLRAPATGANRDLLDAMAGDDSVSVHVRRGDYVADPRTHAYHGTCPPSYYEAAAARIGATVPAPRFFVFSDEPAWARANLELPGTTTVVDVNGVDAPHEDLRLMRACRHHVLANSSLSWWGAWLDDRPGAVVVAPRRWFRAEHVDDGDICPPDWARL